MRASLLFLLLVACGGGDSFEGTFHGTTEGHPVVVTLEEDGDTVHGKVRLRGLESTIEGRIEDGVATGRVGDVEFRATLEEDGDIAWTMLMHDPLTGRTSEVVLPLTRGEAAEEAATASADERDPRLVGSWYEDRSAGGMTGHRVTTRVRTTLSADGRFVFQAGESVITVRNRPGGRGNTDMSDPGNVVRGEWKTADGHLYSRADGQTEWTTLGRYSISGNDMLLYTPNGGKQLWSRP
ncbi:MAG: hypothetical protein AAGD14_10425 [Planctomycetota bacterium]